MWRTYRALLEWRPRGDPSAAVPVHRREWGRGCGEDEAERTNDVSRRDRHRGPRAADRGAGALRCGASADHHVRSAARPARHVPGTRHARLARLRVDRDARRPQPLRRRALRHLRRRTRTAEPHDQLPARNACGRLLGRDERRRPVPDGRVRADAGGINAILDGRSRHARRARRSRDAVHLLPRRRDGRDEPDQRAPRGRARTRVDRQRRRLVPHRLAPR